MEDTGEEEQYKVVCGMKDCDKVLDIKTPISIWGNEKTEEEITTCGDCGDDLDTDEFRSLGWTRDDDEDRREEEEKGWTGWLDMDLYLGSEFPKFYGIHPDLGTHRLNILGWMYEYTNVHGFKISDGLKCHIQSRLKEHYEKGEMNG